MKQDIIVKLTLIIALISSSVIPFCGYVVFLALFIYLLIQGEFKKLFYFLVKEKLLLCTLLIAIFSLIISDYKMDTLLGVGIIFISIFIYIVIRKYVCSINDTIDIFNFFTIGNIIIATYGIIQFYFMENLFFTQAWIDSKVYNISTRAYSTLLNPNVLGGYLVFCICFQITSLENIKSRKINILSLILSSFCLILTYSRGAWLALFIIVFIMLLYRKKIIYMIYEILFFTCLISINGNAGIERMSLSKSLYDHSIYYRLEIYKSTFKIIKDNFLFGTGLNTMKHYINNYSDKINSPVYHAHNLILNLLSETGFIGMIIFGIILMKLVKSILSIQKMEKNIYNSDIAISSALSFVSIFIHGLMDAAIIAPQYLFFVVFIFSLVTNIKNNDLMKEIIPKPCSSNRNDSGGELYGTRDISIKKSYF